MKQKCKCGRSFEPGRSLAGHRARCPVVQAALARPAPPPPRIPSAPQPGSLSSYRSQPVKKRSKRTKLATEASDVACSRSDTSTAAGPSTSSGGDASSSDATREGRVEEDAGASEEQRLSGTGSLTRRRSNSQLGKRVRYSAADEDEDEDEEDMDHSLGAAMAVALADTDDEEEEQQEEEDEGNKSVEKHEH
ncbi:hypothetical protein JCM11251_001670 [Rhodosporidiobolus azoricus]